jgi:hypothetical protein
MLSIALRYISLFVVTLGVLLSGQTTVSAEDRFGDSGKSAASRRDDGTSRDRGDTGRGTDSRGRDSGGDTGGPDGGAGPAGRDSGKDGRGGTDRDGSDRGRH